MRITQRQSVLGFLAFLDIAALLFLAIDLITGAPLAEIRAVILALLIISMMLYAYWRGWDYARHVVLLAITLMSVVSLEEPFLTHRFSLVIAIPPVIAMVFTGPAWVLGSAVTVLLGLLARANWQGVYADPFTIVIYALLIGGMIVARLVLETANWTANQARTAAEAAAHELAAVNASLEATVAARTAELQARAAEQARLLDDQTGLLVELNQQRTTIREMSVPVIPISRHTLIMPLVGALDTERLHLLQTEALRAIEQRAARTLILDVTGVPVLDSQVGQGLLRVVQAARLLGAQVVLVGIRPEVAQAIVGLGMDLREMSAWSDLQRALQWLHQDVS